MTIDAGVCSQSATVYNPMMFCVHQPSFFWPGWGAGLPSTNVQRVVPTPAAVPVAARAASSSSSMAPAQVDGHDVLMVDFCWRKAGQTSKNNFFWGDETSIIFFGGWWETSRFLVCFFLVFVDNVAGEINFLLDSLTWVAYAYGPTGFDPWSVLMTHGTRPYIRW